MKAVTVNNVTYKSFSQLWQQQATEGFSYALARKRLSRGWLPLIAVRMGPIPPTLRRGSNFAELNVA